MLAVRGRFCLLASLGSGIHNLVYERLGHDLDEFLDVEHPIIESWYLVCVGYAVL